jgi:hypothetical protein
VKKIGTLMEELGFRDDAPLATKEAFIKHLIQASFGVEVETPSEKAAKKKRSQPVQEQLSLFPDIKEVG